MKIEELKVGDWVYFDNPAREKKEVAKVVAILNEVQVNIVRVQDNATLLVVKTDLVPIPLTKEILEKNGWKKCKIATSRWLYSYKRKDYPRLNVEKEGFSFHCMDKDIEINAVHQLQHLLWALDINDDLKI